MGPLADTRRNAATGSGILCSMEKTAKPQKPLRATYFQSVESVHLQLPVCGDSSISYPACFEGSGILRV